MPFIPSEKQSTVGVEWEFFLIDPDTRELAPYAKDILTDICPPGKSEHPQAKTELMKHTVEVVTGICDTAGQAGEDLAKTVSEVRVAAQKRGLETMCSGLHPFSRWWDQELTEGNTRYNHIVERHKWTAWRLQLVGIHIHVGVDNPAFVIPILNRVAADLPYLLALSASSPYWHGRDTGLASTRDRVFYPASTAGPPPVLNTWDDYEEVVAGMKASGAIQDLRHLWWDVRPHPDFGTIEIRICDGMSTIAEISSLTALAQCLIDRYAEQLKAGYTLDVPRGWVVRENKWRAARYGLDAQFLANEQGALVPARDLIAELVDGLLPTANRLSCVDELAGISRILGTGASYQRQRAVAEASGGDLTKVVDHLIIEMRDGLHT